jgi:hypothetical protein
MGTYSSKQYSQNRLNTANLNLLLCLLIIQTDYQTMKKLILLLCLLAGYANAQSDTLYFVGGFTLVGTVDSIVKEKTYFRLGATKEVYLTPTISSFVISDSNPNKQKIQKAYINYLDWYNKYGAGGNYKETKPLLTAGEYLKRGANNQLTGLGIGLAGSVVGGIMIAVMEKPTAGYVVIGLGGLIGGILNIAGIVDYRKAGELLDNGKIGKYQD